MNTETSAWQDYRRRRRACIVVAIAFLPVALVGVLLGQFIDSKPLGEITGFLLFAAWAVVVIRWAYFPCPRCHHRFYYYTPVWSVTEHRCRRCGLHVGEEYE
jgi:uncharacterized membrane protein YfcA